MSRYSSRISLREMEMIRAILTHGTMAKAAQMINVSQPAISRMVKQAEDRTGLQLFERRGSKLIPTPDLTTLSREFEKVFASVDRVQALTLALGAGLGRPVHISSMSVLAETMLTPALVDVRRRHPQTPVAVRLNHRPGVEQEVIREESDLGLVHGIAQHDALTAISLCSAHVVCLMHCDHPLATRSELGPGDLAEEPLISMGRLSPLSQHVIDAFDAAGVARRISIQIADSGLAAHFCASGLGLALLDPFFLSSDLPEHLVMRPFTPTIQIECFAIHSNRRVLPDLEADLLESLRAAGAKWERRFRELLAI
jgi:DNA-binding transcriptional LysR family regulator